MKQFSLEEYIKNPSRKIVTRDGRNVTIHCTNYNSNFPIIAEIEGTHSSDSFNKEGKFYQISDSENDLFFALKKKEGWVNVYKSDGIYGLGKLHETEKDAENSRSESCITTGRIEWEE